MRYKVMFRYHLTDLQGEITEYKLSFSVESGSIAEAVRKAKMNMNRSQEVIHLET